MIDVHCHLADNKFKEDIDEVILRAKQSGVVKMVAVAEFSSQFEQIWQLSKNYEGLVYAGIGVHPIQKRNKGVKHKHFEEMETFLTRFQQRNVVCVGEIGLDHTLTQFRLSVEELKTQEEVFIAQIRLAKQFGLPINVHSRSAARRTLEVLKAEQVAPNSTVLHAFDGSVDDVMIGVSAGHMFSIPPSFLDNERAIKMIDTIPWPNLLLETDSPALGPEKGRRNEPDNLGISARIIAQVKRCDVERVVETTSENAQRLFNFV